MLLFETLARHGFAEGAYAASPDDGLRLRGCRIVNAVRCVPPANLPLPAEVRGCNGFLAAELRAPAVRAILALGVVAHQATLRALGLRQTHGKFAHAANHALPGGRVLTDSYHVSRYNQNTGKLTSAMFDALIGCLAARLRD